MNVAVAWGFAWFTPPISLYDVQHLSVKTDDDFDLAMLDVWEKYFPSDEYPESFQPMFCRVYDHSGLRYDDVSADYVTQGSRGLRLVRSGFPIKCLSYHYWTRYDDMVESDHFDARFALLRQPPRPTLKPFLERDTALPLRPLWPGFAINTIFYGVVLWLLFVAPFKLRKWRRTRRGLCAACAYDLRGDFESGCSECGWGRTDTQDI